MNIAVFVKNLTSGGAEKQSILLAKALSNAFNVHYIVFNADFQEPKYLKLLAENPDIEYVAFQGTVLSRFRQFTRYLSLHKIDCIFSYLTAANFLGVTAARLSGVKLIFTGVRNAYLPFAKTFADRILCNHFASQTILNCYSGASYFEKKGFRSNRITVIPNCFENIAEYRSKQRLDNRIRIISVGRFVEQKDYLTALQSIKLVKNHGLKIFYQIVGYGELEGFIRKKIEELGLGEIVDIKINPDNISQLLYDADIYLSTSTFEGTSNSIMEAMNADLPIIATRVGDNDKLVKNKENGVLVNVRNVEAIGNSIIELASNVELRVEMGRKSKELLLTNYSSEIFLERYMKLLRTKNHGY